MSTQHAIEVTGACHLPPATQRRTGRARMSHMANGWMRWRLIGIVVCILLAGFAATTRRVLRDTDVVCRWGGEELIVLAHDCELEDACEPAESLRSVIADQVLFTPDDGTRATISIGVTARRSDDTADSMLARADAALYRAKREGRNCVRVAGEPAELSAATSPVLVAAE
jgi:predicted signal transduction protein with EAL and GGDEF domain